MGRLTAREVESFAKTRGRYGDGDGMYLRVLDPGHRIYCVYRYSIAGKEREISIGPFPEVSLAEARIKHAAFRKIVVVDKRDPLADKRAAKASASNASAAAKPTFGECADHHIAAHASSWRNPKNEQQWRMTLTTYCAPIRSTPVDKVDTEAVQGSTQSGACQASSLSNSGRRSATMSRRSRSEPVMLDHEAPAPESIQKIVGSESAGRIGIASREQRDQIGLGLADHRSHLRSNRAARFENQVAAVERDGDAMRVRQRHRRSGGH